MPGQTTNLENLRLVSVKTMTKPAGLKLSGQENKTMEAKLGNMISRLLYMGATSLLPTLRKVVISGTRVEPQQNSMIATIAVQRCRLQHGKLPASLADLKGFNPGDDAAKNQRLSDPFDGQPLRFKFDSSQVTILQHRKTTGSMTAE